MLGHSGSTRSHARSFMPQDQDVSRQSNQHPFSDRDGTRTTVAIEKRSRQHEDATDQVIISY